MFNILIAAYPGYHLVLKVATVTLGCENLFQLLVPWFYLYPKRTVSISQLVQICCLRSPHGKSTFDGLAVCIGTTYSFATQLPWQLLASVNLGIDSINFRLNSRLRQGKRKVDLHIQFI